MSHHGIWRQIISTSDELDDKAARYAELDGSGNLPEVGLPERTTVPQRETSWRAIDESPGQASAGAEPESRGRGRDELAALESLQLVAHERIATLWQQLVAHPEFTDADAFAQVRNALAMYFDERILERLPAQVRPSWTRLQTEYTGSSVGGEDFYRFLDRALGDPSLPSLVFEIYYFSLSHGFQGRHANNRAQVGEYTRKLAEHIDFVSPDLSGPASLGEGDLREPWPAWRYYLLVLIGAVVYALLLLWWSNYEAVHVPVSMIWGPR